MDPAFYKSVLSNRENYMSPAVHYPEFWVATTPEEDQAYYECELLSKRPEVWCW